MSSRTSVQLHSSRLPVLKKNIVPKKKLVLKKPVVEEKRTVKKPVVEEKYVNEEERQSKASSNTESTEKSQRLSNMSNSSSLTEEDNDERDLPEVELPSTSTVSSENQRDEVELLPPHHPNTEPKEMMDMDDSLADIEERLRKLEVKSGLAFETVRDCINFRTRQANDASTVARLEEELVHARQQQRLNLLRLPLVNEASQLIRRKQLLVEMKAFAEIQVLRVEAKDTRPYARLSTETNKRLLKARRASEVPHSNPESDLPEPRRRHSTGTKRVTTRCQGYDCKKVTQSECAKCGTLLCRDCRKQEKSGHLCHDCEASEVEEDSGEEEWQGEESD